MIAASVAYEVQPVRERDTLYTFLHEQAEVHSTALVGRNTTIWQFATVCAGTEIGEECMIGSSVWIGRDCRIGAGTRIQHGTFVPNGTTIGRDVFLGPNVTLTDDKYPKVRNKDYKAEPPVLEDGCAIGAGAVLLPGVRIGKGALIGAGSVVTRDISAGSTVCGIPARVRRQR